jgi:hypothetical protein
MKVIFLLLLASHLASYSLALVEEWVTKSTAKKIGKTDLKKIEKRIQKCENLVDESKTFNKCVQKQTKRFVRDGALSRKDVKLISQFLWKSCPSSLPESGETCRESQEGFECDYFHLLLPEANKKGVCTGETTCIPTSGCECIDMRWQCWLTRRRLDLFECTGGFPKGSFDPCTP